ncbi:MAG TPA: DUF1631 domain-containing protein [Sedimenticola thiotaurini]|uniref:DUF1631 domain-containing protein n=1 Tax=Sedimenticola thiotaurini TaxID=1543721 RepID=A0A831RMM5_9GAMM|nr:DUF1631 domain-containing protein [Sedimenticola thiotaurini]
MAFNNNILSFQGNQAMERRFVLREEYRHTVNACRQVLLKTVPKLMEGMFEQLDDALYALADKAESDSQQASYFDAMRKMRRERETIENEFNRHLLIGFDHFWQSGPPLAAADAAPQLEQDEFSLVENEDLEEGLAVNNMVSRGENRHYRDLYALNQRIGHMVDREIDSARNPLGPAAICEGFHQVIRPLSLDVAVKIVIYKQFERTVVDALDQLYGETNEVLARGGILPKLSHRVRRAPSYGPAPASGAAGTVMEQAQGTEIDDPRLQGELFPVLQQMLGRRRGGQQAPHVPVVATDQVVGLLSSLQQANMAAITSAALSDLGNLDLRASLQQAIQATGGGEHRMEESDDAAIDVISMLFEFILEDRSLPDAMKALLARLQIPMLKVAILDKEFFSRKNHPARRLLNSMAQAAVGWTEKAGRADGGLYAKMESIVERVLDRFEDDIGLFTELNEEFTAFLEREAQGRELAEKRVAQVTQGKEQLKQSRERVERELRQRLAGRDAVPEVVADLLQEGWRDVLLLILLRQGDDSGQWQDALTLVDRLLWSVEPKVDEEQRQELLQEIPGLLKALRSGLNEISYDQHRMAELFRDLQACHVDCLKGVDPAEHVPVAKLSPPDGDVDATGEAPAAASDDGGAEERESAEKDEFEQRADSLPLGTWLEVTDENGDRFRAKLSWRSKVTGTCLFVNRKGMKVAELPRDGLVEWFRSGRAVELREVNVPLMDRALVAMMKVLDSDGKGAPAAS